MSDPGFRGRLKRALAAALLAAIACGGFGGIGAYFEVAGRNATDARSHVLTCGANVAAVVFWVVFPILCVTDVVKSAAVLDLERRVRFAEELFARRPR